MSEALESLESLESLEIVSRVEPTPIDVKVKAKPTKPKAKPNVYIKNAEGRFVCPHCDVTHVRQNSMYYHLKTHTGIAEYVCAVEGCGKAFIQKSGLDQHKIQTHAISSDSVWGCGFCSHVAKTRANIMIHIGRSHSEGWIKELDNSMCCPNCNKSVESKMSYYYHGVTCFAPLDTTPDTIKNILKACKCFPAEKKKVICNA